jgi:hypothetical protein
MKEHSRKLLEKDVAADLINQAREFLEAAQAYLHW